MPESITTAGVVCIPCSRAARFGILFRDVNARFSGRIKSSYLQAIERLRIPPWEVHPLTCGEPQAGASSRRTEPGYFLMYTTIVDGIIPARFAAAASSAENELWAAWKASMSGTSQVLAT